MNETFNFFEGYLTGTNRGKIYGNFLPQKDYVIAKIIFQDQELGPSIIELKGRFNNSRGEFEIIDFTCPEHIIPYFPLDGNLEINLDLSAEIGSGSWKTEIGTYGKCKIRPHKNGEKVWLKKLRITKFQIWFLNNFKNYYGIIILIIAFLDLIYFDLTFPALFLILLPGLFLFKRQIFEFIKYMGIKNFGKIVEFEQGDISTEQTNNLLQSLKRFQSDFDQKIYFVRLEPLIAPITKTMLYWVYKNPNSNIDTFYSEALKQKANKNDLPIIFGVLEKFFLIEKNNELITISEFGKSFLKFLNLIPLEEQI